MFAGLFGSKKNKIKTILLVDVGSGSVAAGLARLNSDGRPSLLFSERVEMPIGLTRSGGELSEETLKAAASVIETVKAKAAIWTQNAILSPLRIEHVAFFLAAPWCATSVKAVQFSRTKPFHMSQGLLERMLSEEAKSANGAEGSALVVERTAVSLRLNGYPVHELGDAEVTAVEVALATTIANATFCQKLTDMTKGIQGNPSSTFHSFILPASHSLLTIDPEITDTLIIDAGAEVTEILLMKQGAPTARATAPVGTNVLQRTLQSHAQMGKAEGDSALALAGSDGTRLSNDLKGPLSDAAKIWLTGVCDALRALAQNGIPSSVHLFADERAIRWLVEALTETGFLGLATTGKLFVRPLSAKDFTPIADIQESVPDLFLLAELVYADGRFDEGHALTLLSTQDNLLSKPRATLVSTER